MSHFTVLVVGEDIDAQLAPYDENIQVDPYETELSDREQLHILEFYRNHPQYAIEVFEKIPASDLETESSTPPADERVQQLLETDGIDVPQSMKFALIKAHHNGDARFHDGKFFSVSRYNPRSKWDWYQIGGRWRGYFRLKDPTLAVSVLMDESDHAALGAPGVFKNPPAHDADQARKEDIDFDGMRDSSRQAGLREWDCVRDAAGDLTGFRAWKEISVDVEEWSADLTEEQVAARNERLEKRRDEYRKQPPLERIHAVQLHDRDLDEPRVPFMLSYDEILTIERDVYGEMCAQSAIPTYAYVIGGVWHEQGEMGWWGMSSNEKPIAVWHKQFNEMLDSLPGAEMLTVVDAHI